MLTGHQIRTARKVVLVGASFICVLALSTSPTASQGFALTAKELKARLVGPWELAEAFIDDNAVSEHPHGSKPLGIAMFHENGSFVMFFSKPDVQKFAGSRLAGTDAENKAAVRGALSYFGSYDAREGNELVLHIKGSTFPNFNGTDQTRRVRFSQEQRLIILNRTRPLGRARSEHMEAACGPLDNRRRESPFDRQSLDGELRRIAQLENALAAVAALIEERATTS